ncbi:MAG: beta-aspartyl-peptidase [Candidatus Aminicenantales bacterium]
MITLIQEGFIYSPQPLGKKDLLIVGEKIVAVTEPGRIQIKGIDVRVIDGRGKTVIPGLIDSHVHILGGGGEGGPVSRTPEISIEEIIPNGVTTVIGCLGTDGVTRHLESLLVKARALDTEGITAYIFSGSYEIPVKTLTGSVCSDLTLIDKVIGFGEVAVSDHRSSQPTFEEIARLAAHCRIGGMLGGKAGVLHIHLGNGARRLEMIFRLIKETEIPPTQVIPTHVNRNRALLEEAIDFVLAGGYVDLTAGISSEEEKDTDVSVETAVRRCLERKAPLSHISVSSDSNGSLPVFDPDGRLTALTIATQKNLFKKFKSLIQKKILKPDEAVRLFCSNPASFYRLFQKGEIQTGRDADLVFLDKDYTITDVMAKGKMLMSGSKLLTKGTFSKA